MIRSVTGAAVAALTLAGVANPATAADCRAELEAAFEKQRVHAPGYRVEAEQYQEVGTVKVRLDYMLPDRMYQGITAPNERAPIETIAVARWAWGNMGGGWEELQPQFAQSVTAHVAETLGQPARAPGDYDCLGKSNIDGRDLVGYRSRVQAGGGPEGQPHVARTVWVDPATGLPAINIVADAKEGGKVWARSLFSYPADLVVEAPVGAAPAPRTR